MFKYEEDKLNGFSFSFYISLVHDSNMLLLYQYLVVRLHPAVWNTFVMSAAKLCHDRFVCTELFVY